MIGLVTASAARGLDPDLEPLRAAFDARVGDAGIATFDWDDPAVDWGRLDAVVLRSTWDYARRLDEFLGWVDRIHGLTHLVNGPDVVRWNSDKRYLADLMAEGIPVVPTTFVEPGMPAPRTEGVCVVKPAVGAGSDGARRCQPDEVRDHVAALHASGRTAMVQPYLMLLDEFGETAQCFVAGAAGGVAFSHAFTKSAILTGPRVELDGGLVASEVVAARVPSSAERALAERVLTSDAVGRLGDLWYARVDTAPMRNAEGDVVPVVAELELIEPSFYFGLAPGSADRFATAVLDRLGGRNKEAC